MEDIQKGIATMITKHIDTEVSRYPAAALFGQLGLLFEFPKWFKVNTATTLIASGNYSNVEAFDLVPLQGRLDVMAMVVQFVAHRDHQKLRTRLVNFGFDTK